MALIKKIKDRLTDRFGRVRESESVNYWRQYDYSGPFTREPQGKFFVNVPMETIKQYVEQLKPYVRKNEIIGMKHNLRENELGDPHFGENPVFLVYTDRKRKQKVEEILKKEGINGMTYTENNPVVDSLSAEIEKNRLEHERKERIRNMKNK
jgi:hypothetical protein